MAHRERIACIAASSAACALIAACAPEPILVGVPFAANDRAAVIVVEHGEETSAFAVDAANRDMRPVLARIEEFDGTPSIRVTAFLFEKTLSAIGLAEGELAPVPEGARSNELKGERQIVELSIDKEGAGDWRTVAESSGAASMLRIPAIKPCVRLEFTRFDLTHRYFAGMIALTATSALALGYDDDADREGTFYELSSSGVRKLDVELPGFAPRHIMGAGDGTIYVSGGNVLTLQPEVWVGDLRRGFTMLENDGPIVPYGWLFAMDAPNDPTDPAEFYGITEWGQLVRYEDRRWEVLAMIEPIRAGANAELVVNGRNDLYAIAPDASAIYRYSDGALVEEDTPVTPDLRVGTDTLTGLGRAPDYGVYLGSDSGYVMYRTVDGWQQVNEEPLIAENSIRSFSQLPNGALLIGGAYGSLQQYYRTWGLCDDPEDVYFISNTASVNLILPFTDRVMVAGVENRTQTERIIYTGIVRELP